MRKIAVLCSLLLMLVLTTAASARSAALDGWWPLYENSGATAHDLSGHGNTGTLFGGVRWTPGYFGSGLSFDGNTAEVRVADSSTLEPDTAVSVSAYVRATGSPGDWKYIVSKGAFNCMAASYGMYTGLNGGLAFYISQNGGLTYTVSPDAGTGVWDGKWHFVVGTYDGSAVHLYVDGAEVGVGTPASGPIGYALPTSNDLYIGYYSGACPNGGDNFTGAIDEPTVWSRALTRSQVAGTYRLLSALHGLVSRLPSFPGT